MFDTHCHLNFKRFKKNLDDVISRAKESGITEIVIPGTDVKSSKKAVEIAGQYNWMYAAVGIHPHHAFKIMKHEVINNKLETQNMQHILGEIETLLSDPKVVAVGEIGMDKHVYENTKYEEYSVDERFLDIQKELFRKQIELAIQHRKSLIIHNREATDELIEILNTHWSSKLERRSVLHCCEADIRLLEIAKAHHMFIGVDGDVTYDTAKQDFIKEVPIEMLVIETDSPFLLPEPLRSERKYPNEPAHIHYIVEQVARIKGVSREEIIERTCENGKMLFTLDPAPNTTD